MHVSDEERAVYMEKNGWPCSSRGNLKTIPDLSIPELRAIAGLYAKVLADEAQNIYQLERAVRERV
jgi:hypothetical protein